VHPPPLPKGGGVGGSQKHLERGRWEKLLQKGGTFEKGGTSLKKGEP